MSGTVRVTWTANGFLVKDATFPFGHRAVLTVGDDCLIEREKLAENVRLSVRFEFDPPLLTPPAVEEDHAA